MTHSVKNIIVTHKSMQQKRHILGMQPESELAQRCCFSAFQNDIDLLGSWSKRENEPEVTSKAAQ